MKRIQTVGIIGQGYVGQAAAQACLQSGYKVVAVDKDKDVVKKLQKQMGDVQNLYSISTSEQTLGHSALSECEVIIVCVPTPLKDGKPDYTSLYDVATKISPFISNQTLVVLESTVGVGFTRNTFIPMVTEQSGGNNIYFAYVPERIDPGSSLRYKDVSRVISGLTYVDRLIAKDFYSTIVTETVQADSIEEAEAAKLLENSFRLLNVAFINEFAEACSENQLNANEIVKLAASKPFGFMPFYPSAGAGGHCIPVDPEYLMDSLGPINLLREAMISNDTMVDKIIVKAGDLDDKKIAIVGTSYKPGVTDTRESAGMRLYYRLKDDGFNVYIADKKVDKDTDLAIITVHDLLRPEIPKTTKILDVSEGL